MSKSTCHWCHVMEFESFEDIEVAQALNDDFVAIKVDKEERPDIDNIYMNICQAMTGSGGWPLTILMTPQQKAFYAGTYLPKHSKYNRIGLIELLSEVKRKWNPERHNLERLADEIIDFIKKPASQKSVQSPPEDMINRSFDALSNSFDKEFGGFGNAPKFPMPHGLLFLMQYYQAEDTKLALEMAEKTLLQMYKGGIFDHIGFGFSRYSTDNRWLVPHFEKMLYDNALLIMSYTKAYDITKNKIYSEIVEKTTQYIFRELTDLEGAFYCAQDADSEGVEGKYYVFKPKEIKKVLGDSDGEDFNKIFDITSKGNFEGSSIPNLLSTGIVNYNTNSLSKLYAYRKNRYKLHLDDKILTSWNGLMIAALAKAYLVFKNPQYLQKAKQAESFIKKNLTKGNLVFTCYREGKISMTSFIDDYAFFIFGLLELYRVTFDKQYLEDAVKLTDKAIAEFYDEEDGGFYLYGKSGEQLLIRPKETYDGAIPSGNSIMSYNLFMLSKLIKADKYEKYRDHQFEFILKEASDYPVNHSFFMMTLLLQLNPPQEIVCVLDHPDSLDEVIKQLPHDAVVQILDKETPEYQTKNEKTTFYVCRNNQCMPPTNEL